MKEYQVTKLKKELQRKQDQLRQEREDRQNTDKRLVQVQAERDRYYSELMVAKQTMQNVDKIMAINIKDVKSKLQKQNAQTIEQHQKLKNRLIEEKLMRQNLQQQIKNKDDVISELSSRLKELSRRYRDPSIALNVREISDQVINNSKNYQKMVEKCNKLSIDLDSLRAETIILRKLHGVPQNFGFDLQQIKAAEKTELQEYKALSRKLQIQVEELQAERTQLRFRLRQFSALYSNQGDRYKDMTQQQLEYLDQYAINLKDGKIQLPLIDKSQKELERELIKLKAQNQILLNKNISAMHHHKSQQNGSQKLSLQALHKFEVEFGKLINPLRDDVKKLTQLNIPGQQGGIKAHNPNVNGQYKPPMPLPIAYNDWSNINEGFSYLYNSKIPVDIRDLNEDGFSLSGAKYKIAALQLQNIESLKMLKQKQIKENVLSEQIRILKEKYNKCLKNQDQLFIKCIKEREEENNKIKQLQTYNFNLTNQNKQLQIKLNILKQSLNALQKKSEVQKRCINLSTKLADTEAELFKLTKSSNIIINQHKQLKDVYSSLQMRVSVNQHSLRQKLACCKKNQRQLTYFLNKVLDQLKESVSSDVHSHLLHRLQYLNDKTANSLTLQTELRLRINQLQNIVHQIDIKDDVIQDLQGDNFQIYLQLEIVKNRLMAVDKNYKHSQEIFKQFIKFINDGNVSIANLFKKYDKNNSGELSKDQFITAIRQMKFKIPNNQFQLIFSQFDLDGSQTLTIKEVMRKLKRSGANFNNKQDQSIYRLFRAIKLAKITVKQAFEAIDKDGSNSITKRQMQTAFRGLKIDISLTTINYIFSKCDSNDNGKLTLQQFQKIFYESVKEKELKEVGRVDEQLDWKWNFILKLEEISMKYFKGGLREMFNIADGDGDSSLSYDELNSIFARSGVEITKKNMNELFQFMDCEKNDKIMYFQFLKLLEQGKTIKKRVDRMNEIRARAEQLRNEAEINKKNDPENQKVHQSATLQMKLSFLQTKHTTLIKKHQQLIKKIIEVEQRQYNTKMKLQEKIQENQNNRTLYLKQKQKYIQLESSALNKIGEKEAKQLQMKIKEMQIKNEQLTNQQQMLKSLYESLSVKYKVFERRIQQIQKQSGSKKQVNNNVNIEKLKLKLQPSLQNEQKVNRKYDEIVQQLKQLSEQNIFLDKQVQFKQKQIVNLYLFIQMKSDRLQRNIDQLTGKIMPTITISRIEEIASNVKKISNSKQQLEQANKKLRELNFNLQLKNDYIETEKNLLQELQQNLRKICKDQTSIAMIELTKKLAEFKVGQLKAKRESVMLKQKDQYYLRVNNTHIQNIRELQQELSEWEKRLKDRETMWRRKLSESEKLIESYLQQIARNKQMEDLVDSEFDQSNEGSQKMSQKMSGMKSVIHQGRQSKYSSLMKKSSHIHQNQSVILQQKQKIKQLQEQVKNKNKEINLLKQSLQQIIPQVRYKQYGGQATVKTATFQLQTQLTTEQLKANARHFINSQKKKQSYYKEEALKLTEAAQKSIDTYQQIINNKIEQLKRKEQVIEDLKGDYLKQKEIDCRTIQELNQVIRDLKKNKEISFNGDTLPKHNGKNIIQDGKEKYIGQIHELRRQIEKKDEEIISLQERYDKLFISKEKKNDKFMEKGQMALELKLDSLQEERQNQKRNYFKNQEMLTMRIQNLQKLSKQKDGKLQKLQKTLTELKEHVYMQSTNTQCSQAEESMNDVLTNMKKGRTANDSRMEITLQKMMKTIQVLTNRNKDYQIQVKRLKEEKFGRTNFKK